MKRLSSSRNLFRGGPAWFEETDADGPFESEIFETFAEAPRRTRMI